MIEVVACLDYCLKHKKNFERIVIGHLKATRGKDATIQDIYSGLRREWNWYGRNDSRTVRDLLVEGSACLVRYTQIDRENIRRAISRLEQQSRCKTRTADLPASILVKAARTGGPARSLRRRLPSVPSSVSTLSVHSTPEFEGIDEALLGDGKAKAVDDEVERAPSTEAVAVRTQDGTTNSDDGQTTAARWSQTSTHVATQTLSPPSESEALAFRLQQELERSQKEIAGLESQIVTLSNRLFAARRECVDMQKNRSIARMTDQDASVLIQNLRYDVSRLTDHLARRSQQEHDLALASKDALGLSDTRIREEFGLVRAEISDACSSVAPIRPMLIAAEYQTEQGTADVESWSQTLAKCSVHELVSSALRSRLPEDVVLRSLAAVGICSLVFEPHFPDFMTTESPLLDQYRKQIFISGMKTSQNVPTRIFPQDIGSMTLTVQ